MEAARTAYSKPTLDYWDKVRLQDDPIPDPNADIPLCPPCAEEHHAEWTSRWEEYYSGLL